MALSSVQGKAPLSQERLELCAVSSGPPPSMPRYLPCTLLLLWNSGPALQYSNTLCAPTSQESSLLKCYSTRASSTVPTLR